MGIPIIGDLITSVTNIVAKAVPDADKRNEINLELAKLADDAQSRLDDQLQGQIETNKIEAASGSVFVAGWRPAIGWVGAGALAYSYILSPFLSGLGMHLPNPDYSGLYNIVIAMLGVGAMRTYEKVKGVSTNTMQDVPAGVKVTPIATPTVEPPKKHFHIF